MIQIDLQNWVVAVTVLAMFFSFLYVSRLVTDALKLRSLARCAEALDVVEEGGEVTATDESEKAYKDVCEAISRLSKDC